MYVSLPYLSSIFFTYYFSPFDQCFYDVVLGIFLLFSFTFVARNKITSYILLCVIIGIKYILTIDMYTNIEDIKAHTPAEDFFDQDLFSREKYFATSSLLYNILTYTNKNNISVLKCAFLSMIYFYVTTLRRYSLNLKILKQKRSW